MKTSQSAFLSSCSQLNQKLKSKLDSPMEAWQIYGFFCGCVAGGVTIDELQGEDLDFLALDLLDELARRNEDDEPEGYEEGPVEDHLVLFSKTILEVFKKIEEMLDANSGEPELPFVEAVSQEPPLTRETLEDAKQFATGLLRGVVFGVDDEDALKDDDLGEPLGLLFILTEDDPDPDFGSVEEINQARTAVAAGLLGICSRIYKLNRA